MREEAERTYEDSIAERKRVGRLIHDAMQAAVCVLAAP